MTHNERILIIDDDHDFVQALDALLGQHGYQVLHAGDGHEGVLRARREHPDLILVDVMMSERTEGFFVVQELRRAPELAGVPIFVVSAVYDAAPEFDVPPSPAWLAHDAFYRKPIDPRTLLTGIRSALDRGHEAVSQRERS
jgi:two-component system, OmpR family, alkaline phosphatase synthesis response regulator PhoP